MKIIKQRSFFALAALSLSLAFSISANAQGRFAAQVLDDSEAEKIVPTSYYFAGQSAPTQMRNAFAARLGKDRHVLAGLVDTSGIRPRSAESTKDFLSPIRPSLSAIARSPPVLTVSVFQKTVP